MATCVEPIFHLPRRFVNTNNLSSGEFSQSLTFLAGESPLTPDAFNHWRGTPWVYRPTPVNPAVGRILHWGSTPDFNFNFTDSRSLRQPDTNFGVIGSGPPEPQSHARLAKPEIFKFGKSFPSGEQHDEETATATVTVNRVDERSRTATMANTPSLRQEARAKRPNIGPYGDMSNLRPKEAGTDATISARFYSPTATSEDRHRLINADSDDDSDASTSTRVTFDEVHFVTRSTPETRAQSTARARDMVNEERAPTMHTVTATEFPRDSERQLTTTERGENQAEKATRMFAKAVKELQRVTITSSHHGTDEEVSDLSHRLMVDRTRNGQTEEGEQRGRTLNKFKSSATRERSESWEKRKRAHDRGRKTV